MAKLVLFDLDGVLLDSRENMRLAWGAVRTALKVNVSFETYFAEIGRPFGDIMDRLGLSDQAGEAERIFRAESTRHLARARFYEGAERALQTLAQADRKLGIVTSKDETRTCALLKHLPVIFATVRTPNHNYRGKPAPDHLLVGMAEAHVDPGETLYVGDMAVDAEAARRAGIAYAHAAWGYGEAPPGCRVIFGFDDLVAIA